MRLMGLDIGDKTIGVAISDELGISASPLTIIMRSGSVRKEIGEVRKLAQEYGIERIVVGMPYMLDGSVGIQAEKVEAYIGELRRRLNVAIDTWDERLTTSEVLATRADAGRRRKDRRVDDLAAAIILRAYMDRMKFADSGGAE